MTLAGLLMILLGLAVLCIFIELPFLDAGHKFLWWRAPLILFTSVGVLVALVYLFIAADRVKLF
jgi:hypothetical protein